MFSQVGSDQISHFELGVVSRRSRVDPAKTLGLIKRIQEASGVKTPPTSAPKPIPQPIARAG